KLSGISLLKSLSDKPQVIFTTAYSEYALDGYELEVADYLLKPFSFERFVKAVSKVRRYQSQSPPADNPYKREHFIKIGHEHVRIILDEIVYLAADGDYCELWLGEKKYLSSEPLKKWLELLPQENFYRVHKSYIVNTKYIHKISGNQICMTDNKVLPIGRAYREEFFRRFLG